jgi:3-(3-hydroxy-phenyl)propionate hydroxylase
MERRMARLLGHGVPVAHHTLYRVHQRIASTYRVGPVFLAGDAAHINNPLGGMGMNSGIHDACALAKRIALGWPRTNDAELDEYAELRRRVTVDTVDAQTRRNYATLASADPAVRAASMRELAGIARDRDRAREYLLRTSLLQSMRETVDTKGARR